MTFGRGSGGVFAQAASDAETISELKDALQLIWSALLQKSVTTV